MHCLIYAIACNPVPNNASIVVVAFQARQFILSRGCFLSVSVLQYTGRGAYPQYYFVPTGNCNRNGVLA